MISTRNRYIDRIEYFRSQVDAAVEVDLL